MEVATLKSPENREAFEAIAKSFVKVTEGKWTYGWTGEDKNKAIVVSAWDSMKVRFEAVAPSIFYAYFSLS